MYKPIDAALRVICLSCAPCSSDPVITPDKFFGMVLSVHFNAKRGRFIRLVNDTLLLRAHHGQNSTPVPRNDTVT